MGYSTYFAGAFQLSRKLTVTELETFKVLQDYDEKPEGTPGSECPWLIAGKGKKNQLEDMGEEKMYDWDEWLRYILDNVLEPAGVKANGRVTWQGEDTGDAGVIFVKDNQVRFVGIDEMPEPDWDTPEDEG